MDCVWFVLPGLCIWGIILLLPWRPWSTRETLEANPELKSDLGQITVLIPARNEAEYIADTLNALSVQGNIARILLIDDESSDRTASIAESLGIQNLEILKSEPLVPGWSGKLWALEQGRLHAETPYILLLDADICLEQGTLAVLISKMKQENLTLISLMAFLRMGSAWEKMLMPAFIYFFKLLYPFSISNSRSRLVAAAAGGCILIRGQILEEIGGFAAIKDELIDDCSLARRVKESGYRIWTGLTRSAVSRRCYNDLHTIWEMVTRTAFTQLKYSLILLLVCTLLMLAAFVLPVAGLFSQSVICITLSIACYLLMIISYFPTLRYYGINVLWACTLPVTGLLYLLMTWGSAINHWQGTGASWKGRTYSEGA